MGIVPLWKNREVWPLKAPHSNGFIPVWPQKDAGKLISRTLIWPQINGAAQSLKVLLMYWLDLRGRGDEFEFVDDWVTSHSSEVLTGIIDVGEQFMKQRLKALILESNSLEWINWSQNRPVSHYTKLYYDSLYCISVGIVCVSQYGPTAKGNFILWNCSAELVIKVLWAYYNYSDFIYNCYIMYLKDQISLL